MTEAEFWAARAHLLTGAMAKTGATQRAGIANALDADLKGTRRGGATCLFAHFFIVHHHRQPRRQPRRCVMHKEVANRHLTK